MPDFPAISHAAVTVSDLARSTQWYTALIGSEPVLDEDEHIGGYHHTLFALEGGQLFALHRHPQPAHDRFDERRTGLDHVAFACADRAGLLRWAARLDELGILHEEIVDAPYGSGLSFRDPDGNAFSITETA